MPWLLAVPPTPLVRAPLFPEPPSSERVWRKEWLIHETPFCVVVWWWGAVGLSPKQVSDGSGDNPEGKSQTDFPLDRQESPSSLLDLCSGAGS